MSPLSTHARPDIEAVSVALRRSLEPSWLTFQRAARRPARAQAERLRALVRANEATAFGRRHRFDQIDSVAAYRRRVPPASYVDLHSWIERSAAGEQRVLASDPVCAFERSSGSTNAGGGNKLIPYTSTLLREIGAATGPWIYDLLSHSPRSLTGLRCYWSISPAARAPETTSAGIPIGFPSDTDYFCSEQRRALNLLMAVPADVARIDDLSRWRHVTCRHLLAAQDLGLISVWSPTFLTCLMEYIAENFDALLAELPASRARAVGATCRGRWDAEKLWPRLGQISCWADASSRSHAKRLRRWFPTTPIQPKGLLATEGVVSLPLLGQSGSVLAVASHFLEFEDLERPERPPALAHELRMDARYSPLLTTGGGLYRYRLGDVVRCVGHYRRTPLIRFEGRIDGRSDLCGEKLTLGLAEQALEVGRVSGGLESGFTMLAPVDAPQPHYCLFVETTLDSSDLARAVALVEAELRRSVHYRYCRDVGQLAPLRVKRVNNGLSTFQATMVSRGVRVGDIKPLALDLSGAAVAAFSAEIRTHPASGPSSARGEAR